MTITTLLIANRGEIARRIMRTCREMGITTVAVYSDPDAGAPFVHEADIAVAIGGSTPAESYLLGDAIIEAARKAGADAVHPGYGFLSENANFARACEAAGLVWVGPPPDAIDAMGSKLAARELMVAAGVPVLAGVDVTALSGRQLTAAATKVGYPVLVKASYGGGGRGMRIVRDAKQLAEAVESAKREAASAFGNDTVFLERYVERPRHIEIQVMADAHGTVVHLFERECSIQRRHQKIIEEAPSPFVTPEMRARMGAAAVAAARAVGYRGAGTVEFIVAPGGEFFFLEMNTRLQVEHPVTEMVTGLDLVRTQLLVAQGEPLPTEVTTATIDGWAIEVRLYAEDPDHDYLPAPGPLHRLRWPDGGARIDSGFVDGNVVSPHYDPMLAKVIAHAPTRAEAAQLLAWTLRRTQVHGVVTNRELLVGLLSDREFLAGDIDTAFLERHPPAELSWRPPSAELFALAAALAQAAAERTGATVLRDAPWGWRNVASQRQRRAYRCGDELLDAGYAFGRGGGFDVNGAAIAADLVQIAADAVELRVDGVSRRFSVHAVGDEVYVDSLDGSVVLREVPRFPSAAGDVAAGSLVAPMPGTVVRVLVAVGDRVTAGQSLVVLEAMKMEHQIKAPHDGVVTAVPVEVKQAVDAGAVLVVIEGEE